VAADPIFVSPRPPIAIVRADVAALRAATAASFSGGIGRRAARQALARKVHGELVTLKDYVQEVANSNPGEERSIIARAGMSVKNTRGPSKPQFEAKQLTVSGEVHLFARAAKGHASYDWQYRKRKGEGPWLFGRRTVQADVKLYGLERGAYYDFRYRMVTKEGVSAWSQVIRLLVL